MFPQDVKKNKAVAESLDKLIHSDRLVHAFLLAGGAAGSRNELGEAFAAALYGDSLADYIVVEKTSDRQSIVADQIDELTARLKFRPVGLRNVVLIKDAHLMGMPAQNKFLKCLEEPAGDSIIIMLADKADALLATVRSRCSIYYLEDEYECSDAQAEAAADALFDAMMRRAPFYEKKAALSALLNDKDNLRTRAGSMLERFMYRIEGEIASPSATADRSTADILSNAAKCASQASEYLRRLHNPSYTIKQMCLRI